VDWGVAFRYSLIGAAIIGAAILGIFIFDAVWARAGFLVAAGVLAIAVFGLKKWDDRQAARDRKRFERSR